MRKILIIIGFLLIMSLTGCASLTSLMRPTVQVNNNAGVAPLLPYSGLKSRIAVADFDVKVAKATGEMGSSLREMLVTVLVNSNRFSVVEREALSTVTQEQKLDASGAVQLGSGLEKEKIKIADLIITAAVTEFEPEASGGAAGMGGGGSVGSGTLGGLLGSAVNKAHMVLDIRIIDVVTSEVLSTMRIQGQASDVSSGFMANFFGGCGLGGGLSAYANTPMEKAIRVCIIEAVRYVSQATPVNYYKY